jgi:type IV secretory pathway TraG/TraD family ATPase VirD4
MSPVNPSQAKPLGNAKIQPRGKIHLGKKLSLDQRMAATPPASLMYSVGLPEDGRIPAFENPMPAANPGELPRQELKYSLRETPVELYIEDNGLTMSYGIFGAPGSGKTYLLLYLLRQLLQLDSQNEARKFGALILDPKAALIEDMQRIAGIAGRSQDLVVLNAKELEVADESVNIIDVDLEASELARALVLAAQSAGVGASEPYWFGAWQNLFSAAIYLLLWLGKDVLTLRELLDAVLTVEQTDPLLSSSLRQRRIERLARDARSRISELPEEQRPEALAAINQIELFYSQRSDSIATVENLMTTAYGEFLRARTRRYSRGIPKSAGRKSFYDQIIDEGKVVLVSVSPSDVGLAKVLCTLVKNLFMQSVRSRLDRVRMNRLQNFERPLVLACDEYSQVASEIPGQVGDGDFFSIARQQGCMGILATQSVNVLQASALKENWKSIFSNFGAKIFMRAVDNETVEEATKLAGETEWNTTSLGTSSGAQGFGSSTQRDLKERKVLPGHVLTQLIETGQGVIIGSLDGRKTPSTSFFGVPTS